MTLTCFELIDVEGRLCGIDAGWDKFNRGSLVELIVIPQAYVAEIPEYNFDFDEQQSAELSSNVM
ncbi:MAG: hypothetical protein AAFU67_03585, partial [Bacteroidota bacterium]